MCIHKIILFYHAYVCIADLRNFLCHITGSELPQRRTILLEIEDTIYGEISASTCSNSITFPRGVFREYESFKIALNAVISEPTLSFNTV